MKKYLIVMRNTWDEITTYRFNFVMWRFRTLLQLLTIYFLWISVLPATGELFGYTRELMLTYILCSQIVYAIVMTTRTQEIAENINNGDLSMFLVRPWGYFKYWFFRDLGDKAMNIVFSIAELTLIILFLQPQIFLQQNPTFILLSLISISMAIISNFLLSCLLSMTGFWSPEVWAPRFIFYVLLTFFTGGIFPIDILPKPIFNIFMLLPFPYLQYFPIKIYLGQLQLSEILQGFTLSAFWIVIFYLALRFIWLKGLRMYTAAGR